MDTQSSPRICIGLLGGQSTGKSTLLDTLLGNEHSKARKKTKSLICANAVIYKCNCEDEACYISRSCNSALDIEQNRCHSPGHELNCLSVRKNVDFLDCPGNMNYLSTMLGGIMMSDVVFVLSTPEESFSLGPTAAILAAANAMGKHVMVLLNCREETSKIENHLEHIREFTNLIIAREDVPVLQICAPQKQSIKELYDQIDGMSAPQQDSASPTLMIISSSVLEDAGDSSATKSVIIHGKVTKGSVSTNQEVEIRPGICMQRDDGTPIYSPVILKIKKVNLTLDSIAMAGQLAMLTAEPTITDDGQLITIKSMLRGAQLLGHPGSLPGVYKKLKIKVSLFANMFNPFTEEVEEVERIEIGEKLLLTTGATSAIGTVFSVTDNMVVGVSDLSPPSCAREGQQILISRTQVLRWNVIGHGEILRGKSVTATEPILLSDISSD